MKIHFKSKNETQTLTGNKKVSQILEELDINPETVLVVREGAILTHDQVVKNDEEVEIIFVVSGGQRRGLY